MEHEETLYDEVRTVRDYTCLGARMNAGGGCVAVGTRCGWVQFRDCCTYCIEGGFL